MASWRFMLLWWCCACSNVYLCIRVDMQDVLPCFCVLFRKFKGGQGPSGLGICRMQAGSHRHHSLSSALSLGGPRCF